ncbi:MAG TPA: hypothetical protein VFJ09_04640 [Nocardioidaceae bacterium]|nr:hypothetical protein [Nocardioidaceae bacterium]
MADVRGLLAGLDPATAQRVRAALPTLVDGSEDLSTLTQLDVQRFLWQTLPRRWEGRPREQHEVAWAMGDLLAAAGLDRYAALCRDRRTHEVLSAWARDPAVGSRTSAALMRSSGVDPPATRLLTFGTVLSGQERRVHADASRFLEDAVARGVLDPSSECGVRSLTEIFLSTPAPAYDGSTPREAVLRERAASWIRRLDPGIGPFWTDVFRRLGEEPDVPGNVTLSIAPAVSLLQQAEAGIALTAEGHLPASVVTELDARFGWTDKLPSRRPSDERAIPALLFVDTHLREQQLITQYDGRLALTGAGRRCLVDPALLWQLMVSPGPRWTDGFEQDALAVMAVCLLRQTSTSGPRLTEQVASLLSRAWRSRHGDGLEPGVEWLRVEWYRLGVGMSWWELSWRPEHYRLSEFGRSAAAELFWAVAGQPTS